MRKLTRPEVDFTVELVGGVGNQLFTYTAALAYASQFDRTFAVDDWHSSKHFNKHGSSMRSLELQNEFLETRFPEIRIVVAFLAAPFVRITRQMGLPKTKYVSPVDGYDPDLFMNSNYRKLRGYFQTYKYFDLLTPSQKAVLSRLKHKSSWYTALEKEIRSDAPICVHIRRGDYLLLGDLYGVLSLEYFVDAVARVTEIIRDSQRPVWVFSDDVQVARNFSSMLPNRKVTVVIPPSGADPLESLLLISQGFGVITSNSSFSWWAARLSSSAKIVVAPTPWHKTLKEPFELIPENWSRFPAIWE